ncbi:DUF4367 domain-containing protein [Bacillus sp. AK031]
MKKVLFMLTITILILFGCSSSNSTLHNFDTSQLEKEMDTLSFQPKLPTKIPFEETNAQFSQPPSSENIITIDFMSTGESTNHLGLMIVNGKSVESSDLEFEEVTIGNNKGKYAVNNAGAMIVKWTDNNISYDLGYYGQQSDKEITKEELIETAESFK